MPAGARPRRYTGREPRYGYRSSGRALSSVKAARSTRVASIGGWLRRVVSRFGRDRRWISDGSERTRHDAIVRERLVVPRREATSLVEAANRLGVSVQTVRRRVKRGQLDAAYDARGHISRVYLDEQGESK